MFYVLNFNWLATEAFAESLSIVTRLYVTFEDLELSNDELNFM